jgi:hypothetical protein
VRINWKTDWPIHAFKYEMKHVVVAYTHQYYYIYQYTSVYQWKLSLELILLLGSIFRLSHLMICLSSSETRRGSLYSPLPSHPHTLNFTNIQIRRRLLSIAEKQKSRVADLICILKQVQIRFLSQGFPRLKLQPIRFSRPGGSANQVFRVSSSANQLFLSWEFN